MNVRIRQTTMIVAALLAAHAAASYAQAAPSPVVEWVRAHARSMSAAEGTSSAADLATLAPIVGDARVIGLGEAEHGVHEFLAFRNRFVRYAVESLGVTAIAAETGFTESTAVDDYVLGRGELTPAIVGSVFSWSAGVPYAENRALLEWVRGYNARPSTTRKVHFYGIDLTGGRGGRFLEARGALDAALDYVALVDTVQARTLRASLEALEPRFATGRYDSLTVEQQNALTATIDDLASLFARRSAAWPARTSPEAFDRAYRSAVVARQLDANFRAARAESNPQAQREAAMAENLAWVLQREGRAGRVLLYEANWHLSRGPMTSDRWGSSLGEHLRSTLGTDYVAIATSYGELRATPSSGTSEVSRPDSASAAAVLSGVCASLCRLTLREVPGSGPVADWFGAMRPIQGGRVDNLLVSRAFDALVFFRTVHPAERAR